MDNINDEGKWSEFVDRLVSQTKEGRLKWEDFSDITKRKKALGPIFVAEIIEGKYVAVFRYEYDYYTELETYETRQNVTIQLVNESGEALWRLPEVGQRYKLIDHVEYQNADVQGTLDEFLKDNDAYRPE